MKRTVTRKLLLALAALGVVLSQSPPANATAGVVHVAVGEDTSVLGYCIAPPGALLCLRSFSIDASNRPGAYGRATYSGNTVPSTTDIAFTCVVVEEIVNGHTLYASGTGTGGSPGQHFVKLTVVSTGSSFGISRQSTGGYCGASGVSTRASSPAGAFQISPVA